MSEYYGTPAASSDFLAHYGVKGMRWGVRKAIESGNTKRLERHYTKANKKLASLKKKADVISNLNSRKLAPAVMGSGLVPAGFGAAFPIMAKATKHKMGVDDKIIAGVNAAFGAGIIGAGAHDLIAGSRRTKAKGHDKAVRKVNEWQKEMKNTFKNTKYEQRVNAKPEFNDTYTLYEHGTLGKDGKGREIPYRTPTVSISGSSLVRDNNSKAKQIFKKRLTDSPQTQKMSDSKVMLLVHTPSGGVYNANEVNKLLKIKKKHK